MARQVGGCESRAPGMRLGASQCGARSNGQESSTRKDRGGRRWAPLPFERHGRGAASETVAAWRRARWMWTLPRRRLRQPDQWARTRSTQRLPTNQRYTPCPRTHPPILPNQRSTIACGPPAVSKRRPTGLSACAWTSTHAKTWPSCRQAGSDKPIGHRPKQWVAAAPALAGAAVLHG